MKPQKYKPQHPRNGKPIHLCISQLQSKVVIAARLQLAYNFLAGLGARKIYTNPLELVSCEGSKSVFTARLQPTTRELLVKTYSTLCVKLHEN